MSQDPDILIHELNSSSVLPNAPTLERLYEAASALCDIFRTSSASEREALADALGSRGRRLLLSYAWKMAERAVEKNSPELVHKGLTALAIEGGRDDFRDTIMSMVVLHHSACKLGMDVVRAFADAADLFPAHSWPSSAQTLRDYPSREDRGIECWEISEQATPDGVKYKQSSEFWVPRRRKWWQVFSFRRK